MSAPRRGQHSRRRPAGPRSVRHRFVLAGLAILSSIAVGVGIPTLVDAATSLVGGSWSLTSTQTGQGASYSYVLAMPASGSNMTSITITVPPGTTMPASPSVTVLPMTPSGTNAQYKPSLTMGTASYATNTVTIPASGYVNASTVFWVTITGVTNSSTAGTYQSTIQVLNGTSPVATVTSPPVTLSASALANAYWSTSATTTGATNTTYSYAFTTTTATSALSAIVVSVPPGTAGTPTTPTLTGLTGTATATLVTTASSPSLDTVTIGVPSQAVAAGTVITVSFGGLTNTSLNGDYGEEVLTESGSSVIDTAALIPLDVTQTGLTSLSWSPSSTTTNATNVAYSYSFTSGGAQNSLTGFQLSVPPGTAQSGSSLTLTYNITYNGSSTESLGTTTTTFSATTDLITISFASMYFQPASVVQLTVSGLTNTSVAGSYQTWVTTLAQESSGYYPTFSSGTAVAATFSSGALTLQSWSTSSSAISATNVTYTYSFGFSGTSAFDTVKMSVPGGTGGTPTVGTVTPSSVASGGSVTLSGGFLTYTFSGATVTSSQTISISIGGMTNTATAGSYQSTVTATSGGQVVASGVTPAVSFTATVLTNVSWSASPTTASATGATYTYSLTTASATSISSITMTVPSGTSGAVTLGPVTVSPSYISLSNETLALVSSPTAELKLSFTSQYLPSGAQISIEVDNVTNTPTAGNYQASIATLTGTQVVDSGTSQQVDFTASSLSNPLWSASNNGTGASGVSYTFSFQVPTSVMLDTITMAIPSGTGGTASLASITPSGLAGGTLTQSTGLLTYSLAPSSASIAANSAVTIVVSGLKNTSISGSYTSTINVSDQGTAIASGTTPAVTFTSTVLSALSWSVSSNRTSTANVSYTYGFTTGSTANIQSVRMTVPAGTSAGSLTATATAAIAGGTVSLNAGTDILTYAIPSAEQYVANGTALTIAVYGLINPSAPGTSSSTVSTVAATSGSVQDSGTTNAITFVGGALPGMTWKTSNPQVQATGSLYTWTFTTASSSTLTSVQLSVPNGTSATSLALDPATTAAFATGSATLAGTTVTLSFSATSVAAGSPVTIAIDNFTNTAAAGSYTSVVTTFDGASSIDTGTTGALWFLPIPSLGQFSNACPSPPLSCAAASGGTQLVIVAIPGGPVATGTVVLSVKANSASGYRLQAETSALQSSGGGVLAEAPTSGSATLATNSFAVTAALAPASGSGAALCAPFGSATPYVGLSSSLISLWDATGSTGSGSDTVRLTANLQVGITQAAGSYTGTISYVLQPANASC